MRIERRTVVNVVLFQLAWFACVVSAANELALLGTLSAVAVVGIHLTLVERARPELLLILAAALIGAAWESVVIASGLLTYPSGFFAPGIAPHWIIAMWALFATTLNVSLGWLRDRAWLAAVLGAVGGPLSYLAGNRLGAVEIADIATALGAQAAGWAVLMPALIWLATRLNGAEPRRARQRGVSFAGYGDHA